jgi:hypothetical protein
MSVMASALTLRELWGGEIAGGSAKPGELGLAESFLEICISVSVRD